MPTALIVEDEPEANHLLSMLVQLRGYRTDSAYTGGEALEKVRNQPPDIVFLDLMLPDINGYEVCKTLKTRRTTSLIPVVMVTARVAEENRLQSFCAGANDYIPKPYTPDQIFQAMADADAWRRDVAQHDSEGQIRFESHGNGESLRRIAQLRSLLVARSTLDLEAIGRIGTALSDLATSAEAWGRGHDVNQVGVLSYRVGPDQLRLELQASAGWMTQSQAMPEERWPRSLGAARFDETDVGPDDGRLQLVRWFPPAETRPAD